MRIGAHELGGDNPAFVVAEIGLNHGGSVDLAKDMIHAAAHCGVDAVKFGVFKADEFCRKSDPLYAEFKRCELPDEAWYELKAECEKAGVVFFATPQNVSDMELLLKVGVPCLKVGSDDLCNHDLIRRYAATGLPLILSAGMATKEEAEDAYDAAIDAGKHSPIMLACTSEYPCSAERANIGRVLELRGFAMFVGYSDHTESPLSGVIARNDGACYLERHFTLDRSAQGPDHRWSSDPAMMTTWVWGIRQADVLLGSGQIEPTEAERENRKKWRRASGQALRGEG